METIGFHKESELAETLGVERKVLEGWRKHMTHGDDWTYSGPRNVVGYTDKGLEKIQSLAGVKTVLKHGETAFATVATVPQLNKNILVAKFQDGIEFKVRVKDNSNFLPGMPIEVLRDVNDPAGYLYVGKLPRFRGRY